MDRNEQNLRIESLRAAIRNKDYERAVDIADTLDLKKVKDNNFLSLIAGAYEANQRYAQAKTALLMAYENTNAGRHLAYRLCLLSVKNKEFDEAEEFYQDFVEMAPRDTARYVMQYEMAKAKGEPLENLIEILEEYVNIDMDEKWAYELAKLYHQVGNEEKCVDMCDEICLWFAEGKYVIRAMELKQSYRPLTSGQQERYEEGKKKLEESEIEEQKTEAFQTETKIEKASVEEAKTDEEEAKAIKASDAEIKEVKAFEESVGTVQETPEEKPDEPKEVELMGEEIREKRDENRVRGFSEIKEIFKSKKTDEINEVDDDPLFLDIMLKAKRKNKYDTMEIQAVVAEGMKEVTLDDGNHQNQLNAVGREKQNKSPEQSVSDVQNILWQLQERGILKAETVNQVVNIIEEDEQRSNHHLKNDNIMERWEADNVDVEQDASADQKENTRTITPAATEIESDISANEPEEALGETKTFQIDDLKKEAENIGETKTFRMADRKPVQEKEEIPVFDLDFDAPKRDKVQDVGQSDMYESIKASSELGGTTDKLPDKKEIDAAMNHAKLHSEKQLSAKVEILSGADWKQPEDEPNTADATDNQQIEKPAAAEETVESKAEENAEPAAEETAETQVVQPKNQEIAKPEVVESKIEETVESEAAQEAVSIEETAGMEAEQALPEENAETEDRQETTEEIAAYEETQPETEETVVPEELQPEAEEVVAPEELQPEAEETVAPEELQPEAEEVVAPEEIQAIMKEAQSPAEEAANEKEVSDQSKVFNKSFSHRKRAKKLHVENLVETDAEPPKELVLTPEDMSIFKNYLNVEGFETNIREVLQDLIVNYTPNGKSTDGNVVIMGNQKTGKTTLAIELIKLVNRKRGRRNRKLAKIDALALNRRGFRNSLNRLLGCDLIVENAHKIGVMTLSEVVDASAMFTDDMLIVLEGDLEEMEQIMEASPRLSQVFNHVIKIREYNIKEWVAYGIEYAGKQGYVMDELANLAFYKAIDDSFGDKKGIGRKDVEEIVDRAINRTKRLGRKLFSSKKDEEGNKVLVESDFNV